MKCKIWIAMSIVLFPAFGAPGPNPSDSEVDLVVKTDGNFQLNAKQAPLKRIIERIQQNTKTALNYLVLPEDLTTVACDGTVETLIKCVLGDATNLMIKYREATTRTANADVPEEIWILGSSDSRMASEIEAETPTGPCGALQSASSGAFGQEQRSNDPGKPVLLSQQQSDALLNQMRSQDLAARTEAITRLASVENDGEVLDSLHEALSDQHPAIRAQAVSTLAARKAPGADRILREALLDPDSDVRLMAVDHAGDDESLLLTALDDANNNVRQLANMKLEQLYNQDSFKRQ